MWHRASSSGLAILLIVTVGCFNPFHTTKGSGVRTTVTREVPAFHALEVGQSITVDVTIGDEMRLEITGDDNLVPLVATSTSKNGTMSISVDGSYSTNIGLKVTIQTPELKSVHSANASRVVLHGKLQHVELVASNAATIDGADLQVNEAVVNASNAAQITIRASDRVSGTATNAATVEYVGECKRVEVETSNAASIRGSQSSSEEGE